MHDDRGFLDREEDAIDSTTSPVQHLSKWDLQPFRLLNGHPEAFRVFF